MFTGLIRDVGEIAQVDARAEDRVLTIRTAMLDEAIGASIACNGICLTVTEKDAGWFRVMASAETLAMTTAAEWKAGRPINLEPSLRLGDSLGGHMVYGHVDGRALCVERKKDGESWRFFFEVAEPLARFIAPKGSVALDGISLTVNEGAGNRFGVNIIPHTMQHTNFMEIDAGSHVNIEIDMLARYVARLHESKAS